MSQRIIIFGEAGQRIVAILPIKQEDFHLDLLSFMRKHNLPIAASCFGEGHCKKCIINSNKLSCQIKIQDYLKEKNLNSPTVSVSYL